MSLTRSFFNEFRPLFRLLEEPFFRPTAFNTPFHSHPVHRGAFLSPFRPNVYVAEQPKAYVVEAELPGVRKEDLEVRVGDNGQSIVIEGKLQNRWRDGQLVDSSAAPAIENGNGPSSEGKATAQAVETPSETVSTNGKFRTPQPDCSNTAQRTPDTGNSATPSENIVESKSTFTRTIWLPRPVDSSGVSAKLQDGMLTLTVPKREDAGAVRIAVE